MITPLVQPADTAMRIVVNAVALIGNVCGAARPLAAGAVAFVPLLPWSLRVLSLAGCGMNTLLRAKARRVDAAWR